MNPDLTTYLHDHIAGANAAIEVNDILQNHSKEPAVKTFSQRFAIEVREDKLTLEAFTASLDSRSSTSKDMVAWVGARIVTIKARGGKSTFGAFECLEFLSLGIQGKLNLWKALQRSATCIQSPNKPDFNLLIKRAEDQHRHAEDLRLALAAVAL